MKPREIHIYPVGVFWFVPKKCSIPYDVSIYRVFKRIGKFRRIKRLISMGRKIDSEITPGFGRIDAVAGK
jgi:hypothetical protein